MDMVGMTALSVMILTFIIPGAMAFSDYLELKQKRKRIEIAIYLRMGGSFLMVSCLFKLAGKRGGAVMVFGIMSIIGAAIAIYGILSLLVFCRERKLEKRISLEYENKTEWKAFDNPDIHKRVWTLSPVSDSTIMRLSSGGGRTISEILDSKDFPSRFYVITGSEWKTCRVVDEPGEGEEL